jgi:hypothetical protein
VCYSRAVKIFAPFILMLMVTACDSPSKDHASPAWGGLLRSAPPGGEERGPTVVSDLELRPFLPQKVLGRSGGSPQGSVTRMGDRSLSEVTRAYPSADGQTELKLADARFEPHATETIRTMADDVHDGEAHRLVLPGAIGYSLYDEDKRVAQAQVVIGGRFIASATVQQAQDSQAAVAALRTLDTMALSRLAQSN